MAAKIDCRFDVAKPLNMGGGEMKVAVRVIAESVAKMAKTECTIEIDGIPDCEARELKEYLDGNMPSLENVAKKILEAHRAAIGLGGCE